MNARNLLLPLMLLGLVATALGNVYAKHQSRKLFVELQGLEAARDEMNIEWGQLQLEQSTWSTHVRVEDVARAQLGMTMPAPEALVVIRP
ncbi:MAG: cell division protein FtsL [Gammaproteobacteria bacterium]